MEWLFILGLGAWAWRQGVRIDALERRLDDVAQAETPDEPEPHLLTERVHDDDHRETLLLDTPVPEPSNDAAAPAPPPRKRFAHRVAAAGGAIAVTVAAFAPWNAQAWPAQAPALAACALGATALLLAAARRWAWLAAAALAGLYLLFGAAMLGDQASRAPAYPMLAAFGAALLALRNSEANGAWGLSWRDMRAQAANAAIGISSLLSIGLWFASAQAPSAALYGPLLAGGFLLALATLAVRWRAAAAPALIAALAALALGFAAYLQQRRHFGPLPSDFYPALLAAAAAMLAAAFAARPHRSARAALTAAALGGACLMVALAAFSRPDWHGPAAWAPLFGAAAALALLARRQVLQAPRERSDAAADAWIGAAAALALLGIESAFPLLWRSPADAGLALLLASAWAALGWRALHWGAAAAAGLALLQAFAPELSAAALAGEPERGRALGALTLAAAAAAAASRVSARRGWRWIAWTLGAAAIAIAVIAALLALRQEQALWRAPVAFAAALGIVLADQRARAALKDAAAAGGRWLDLAGARWAQALRRAAAALHRPGPPPLPMTGGRRDRRRARR